MTESVIGAAAHRLVKNEKAEKVDANTRTFKLSDSSVALDGHTLATDGWDLSRAKENLPVLWAHDSDTVEHVLGQWKNLRIQGDSLIGDAEFMPRETNPTAGMVLDMIDGGWLRMCSVGFVPTEGKPSKRGPGSYDFTRQTLLEASIVPVGSLATALIEARDAGIDISPAREWAKRNLETEDMARKRATAPAADAPKTDPVETPAETPVTTENQPSARKLPAISKRGLYLVAQLASELARLDYLCEAAEAESEQEGDDSPVPGMLMDVLASLGAALIAMTQEEVAEMLSEDDNEGSDIGLYYAADGETRAALRGALLDAAEGKEVTISSTRAVNAKVRVGKAISKETLDTISTVHEHCMRAMEHCAGLMKRAADSEGGSDSTHESGEEARAAARALRERKLKALQAQVSG